MEMLRSGGLPPLPPPPPAGAASPQGAHGGLNQRRSLRWRSDNQYRNWSSKIVGFDSTDLSSTMLGLNQQTWGLKKHIVWIAPTHHWDMVGTTPGTTIWQQWMDLGSSSVSEILEGLSNISSSNPVNHCVFGHGYCWDEREGNKWTIEPWFSNQISCLDTSPRCRWACKTH